MASADDIITYIGVPLAVLGVLPILYNTIVTLAVVSRVKRLLRYSNLSGITRGDVINRIIEIDLPRYSITPLDRELHEDDYWHTTRQPSLLAGGSWTTFHWRTNITGMRTQRVEYVDQVRQPQAEINFEELISYLLDLGAVPNPAGFRMLRTSGLWVPTGTALMLSPNKQEAALKIAPLEDSDGHLSLAVHWSRNWEVRGKSSLPPYWMRVPVPTERLWEPKKTEDEETNNEVEDEKSTYYQATDETHGETKPLGKDMFMKACYTLRCQISANGLVRIVPEDCTQNVYADLPITHLEQSRILNNVKSAGSWFAIAATAYSAQSQASLWNYDIPSPILQLGRSSLIPCGVAEVIGILPSTATPTWATVYDDVVEEREHTMRQMRDRSHAIAAEQRMDPADRQAAARARQQREFNQFVDHHRDTQLKRSRREEQRLREALASTRWSAGDVAPYALTWLVGNKFCSSQISTREVFANILFAMVRDEGFAHSMAQMLDAWAKWGEGGSSGLGLADLTMLREGEEQVKWFALATILLACLSDASDAAQGSSAVDLQECMAIWKTVRLG